MRLLGTEVVLRDPEGVETEFLGQDRQFDILLQHHHRGIVPDDM